MSYYAEMGCYPELRFFFEGFTDGYTRITEAGLELTVGGEELTMFGEFLLGGIADWVVTGRSGAEGDCLILGEFLDKFADRSLSDSDVSAAFQVTQEEMIGLGLYVARGVVALFLRLERDRGRFNGFGDVIGRKRSCADDALPRRLIARTR
jgi:hypothetical protein